MQTCTHSLTGLLNHIDNVAAVLQLLPLWSSRTPAGSRLGLGPLMEAGGDSASTAMADTRDKKKKTLVLSPRLQSCAEFLGLSKAP